MLQRACFRSAILASYRMSGWRLPSPAWNTLAQRRLNCCDRSSICAQHLRQRPARNRPVDAIVIRGDPADRGERGLPARPEQQALALVLRHADPGGAGRGQHARDLRHVRGHFLGRAVGLDQQHRRRVERIAGVHELLDRARRAAVHHFEPRGHDAGGDDGGDRGPRRSDVVERGERDLRRLRLRRELDRDFGRDREQALGAVDERQQVVARAVEGVAAELDDLAGDEHAAHAAHVVHRQPVLEAVHAARVLADVAADRARDLRRRIRRVVEAVRAPRPTEIARLRTPGCTTAVHATGSIETMLRNFAIATRTPRLSRQRAARQARPGTARDHGHTGRMTALAAPRRAALRFRESRRPRAARGTS